MLKRANKKMACTVSDPNAKFLFRPLSRLVPREKKITRIQVIEISHMGTFKAVRTGKKLQEPSPVLDTKIELHILKKKLKNFFVLCSGSGRIRIILPGPDRHPGHAEPDPDQCQAYEKIDELYLFS